MPFRATCVCQEPLDYFLQTGDGGPHLRVSDVILRCNQNPRDILSHFIRLASNSKWSHSALVYLVNDPPKGFNNTFLVEAMTTGIRVASWRNEVVPYEQFTGSGAHPQVRNARTARARGQRYRFADPGREFGASSWPGQRDVRGAVYL